MVYMMKNFIKNFNRFHLNKLLDIQGKDFKDLPTIPEHMNEDNKRVSCVTGRHLVLAQATASFCHIAGDQFTKEFVMALCDQIIPHVKMITTVQDYLPDRNTR